MQILAEFVSLSVKVLSSAYCVILDSVSSPGKGMPFMFGLDLTLFEKGSMHRTYKSGLKGQPCLKPL